MISVLGLTTVVFALAGCPKSADTRRPDKTSTSPASPGAAAAEDAKGRLDSNKVVVSWDGGQMTYGDLRKKKEATFKKLYNKYVNDVFAAEQQEVDGFVTQTIVEKQAKEAGKTPEEFVQSLVGTITVTDPEIQEFYDKNVKQSGQPLDSIKDRIRPYLENQKRQEKMHTEFERLKKEAHVKIDLPAPEISPVSFALDGRPMRGNPKAKVTIVAFSDFQCPYCSKATAGVDAVLKAYPNDVKFYFLHFPLSFHQSAMPAAIASQCANQQNKFWEFHDKLFSNQQGLEPTFFKSTAKEIGLDEAKFTACLEDPSTKARVSQDMEQGTAAGVEGTPSFFINGAQFAQGVPSVEAVKGYVERSATN